MYQQVRGPCFCYLAQKPSFWTGIIFIGVYVSVCLRVCHSIISKSSQSIFMKLGRMVYDDKISVPFEDEINRLVEEHTLPKRMVKIDIKPTYLAISQKVFYSVV